MNSPVYVDVRDALVKAATAYAAARKALLTDSEPAPFGADGAAYDDARAALDAAVTAYWESMNA